LKEVSLIIPTYNERENLHALIERISGSLTGYEYEVVVVDDNSIDGTGQLADELSEKYPIRVIHRAGKEGLASAIVDGYKLAEGEILGVLDADLQHPPEKISNLLKEIKNGKDIAIASRYIKNSGIEKWSFKRKIISKGSMILAYLIFPKIRPIKDPLSGFFLIKRSVVNNIILNPVGYKILLEILVRGRYSNVVEVPYVFRDRNAGKSNLNIKEQINYLQHLYLMAKSEGEIKRLLRFGSVGVSGIFVNEGILYLLTEHAGWFYLISSVLAAQFAILNNFILNHIWTFKERRSEPIGLFNRLGRFELISIAGAAVSIVVLFILTSLFGLHYLISNLIAIVIAFMINFLGNSLWTWRK
jgi:dolichol-phosphate mannosyltransferase